MSDYKSTTNFNSTTSISAQPSKTMKEHMNYCNTLNDSHVSALNKAQTQQELNQVMANTFKAAEKDLGCKMTYAELRERFG